MSYPLVHARDVSLCLEDQGPYILGLVRPSIPSSSGTAPTDNTIFYRFS